MIKFFKDIFDRATGVRNETAYKANTALKIGSLFQDTLLISATRFDPEAPYLAGQYVIVDGVLAEVVIDTNKGETPSTHPLKWSVKLVLDPSQVTATNNLPIAASTVFKLLNTGNGGGTPPPNADATKRGLAKQASDEVYEAGASGDAYTTPKQVKGDINKLADSISKIPFQYSLGRFVTATNYPDFNDNQFTTEDYFS